MAVPAGPKPGCCERSDLARLGRQTPPSGQQASEYKVAWPQPASLSASLDPNGIPTSEGAYTVMFMDIFVTRRDALSVGAPVAEVPKQ